MESSTVTTISSKQHAVDTYLRDKTTEVLPVVRLVTAPVTTTRGPPTRNVLLVGRSRSGKSTVASILHNPCTLSVPMALMSQTKESSCTTLEVVQQDSPFHIRVVDTPGLFERAAAVSTDSARSNEQLKEILKLTSEKFHMPKVHVLCFVCSFGAGINKEDIDTLQEVLELIGLNPEGASNTPLNRVLALVVTRCENKTVSAQKKVAKQIRDIPELKSLFPSVARGQTEGDDDVKILFTGAVDRDYRDNGLLEGAAKCLTNVVGMRQKLLRLIETSHDDGYELWRADSRKQQPVRTRTIEVRPRVLECSPRASVLRPDTTQAGEAVPPVEQSTCSKGLAEFRRRELLEQQNKRSAFK